ncbi:hypothetical protein V1264_019380 [Littorina saxatilis]|uniref:Uncharacterized protein n=1 Tax=Littorina saxatilis TaxID=31220 RepID=A0AAN9BFS4_9CAEN
MEVDRRCYSTSPIKCTSIYSVICFCPDEGINTPRPTNAASACWQDSFRVTRGKMAGKTSKNQDCATGKFHRLQTDKKESLPTGVEARWITLVNCPANL